MICCGGRGKVMRNAFVSFFLWFTVHVSGDLFVGQSDIADVKDMR